MTTLCLAFAGCGDDLPGTSASEGTGDADDDDDTSTGETLPPTNTSLTVTDSTTTTSETDTTVGSSTTTDDPSSGSSSSESGSSSESSSSTGEDIDLDCEGPAGDDTCDTPSPYDGEGECDPYAQDCPDGEKCMPWANDGGNSWNSTRCSPLAPDPAQLGDECLVEGSGVSGVDDCDIGLMCWSVDPRTNMGECIELCGCGPAEPTCAGGGTFCIISNEGSLPVCLPTCDPLLTDECPAGEGCYPVDSNFLCAPDSSGEQGGPGDPCEFINVCDPGLLCTTPDAVPGCAGAGCCTEFCDLDTPVADCSNPATECVAFFPAGTEPEDCHLDTGICVDAS